ncbi:MAG: RDD family protein [Lachnospiraceae bacterium]
MLNNWNKSAFTFAGFWVRLAAYVIDSVIVFFALLFVRLFSSGVMSLAEGTPLGGNVLFTYTLKDIILYAFQVLYFILFTYYTGTTPGKRLMNLYVMSAEGKRLSLTDVVYRETIGRFLCGATVGIGYIMAGVDKEKRGLHDMLCDTRVVYMKKIKAYPNFQMPPDINIPPVPRQVTPPPGAQPPYMQSGRPQDVPSQRVPGGVQRDMSSPHVPGGMPQDAPPQMPGTQPTDLGGGYRMVRPEDENKERDSQE